jgi:ankyrin repeat protein
MKTATWSAVLMLMGALAPDLRAADPAQESLQKGLIEEEANRDLDAAIQAYQAALDQFDDQRKTAGTAVFRLAECYRKLGKTNEAGLQYQRVVREFADQTNLLALSRKELDRMPQFRARSGVGRGPATGEIGAVEDAQARQKELLQQELALVEQSLEMAQKRFESGRSSNEEILKIQREILTLKRQMAELDAKRPRDLLSTVTLPSDSNAASDPATTNEETQEIERLKALKENSPDLLEAQDNGGRSPLHGAVARGYQNAATYLLDQGVNADARDHRGNAPLHMAVSEGRKTIVELLLARGAEVNAKNGAGATPLHGAAARGFKAIAETLIAKGADVNAACGQTRLYEASKSLTLSDVFIDSGTPLHNAVGKGFRSMVELLLAHQADLNGDYPDGGSPLALAVQVGRTDMVKLLLEHGADVNGKGDMGNTPLHWAIEKGSEEIVGLILARKPRLELKNLQDLTPLQLAINAGQIKLALELLKAGANPNVRFEAKGVAPVTPFRRQNELPPGGRDVLPGDGATPLHWAVQWGFKPVVEGLLNAKADVNAKDDYGNTPLHLAAGQRATEIMEMLLARKAEVNATTRQGMTALHNAVLRGDKGAVELLLAKGADPAVKNQDGQTPFDFVKPRQTPFPVPATIPSRPSQSVRLPRGTDSVPVASPSELAEILKKYGAKE